MPKFAVQTFVVPNPVRTLTSIWTRTKVVQIANMAVAAAVIVNMAVLEDIVAIINAIQMRNVSAKNVSGFNF